MKNLKTLSLTILAVTFVLSFTVLGKPRTAASKKPFQLGIEITTEPNGQILYLPAGLTADKSPIAYVPVQNGGYISAVRVIPVMENGKVKVEVSVVSGDYRAGKCEELKNLPRRLVETRSANKDEAFTVIDEISGGPWWVSIKAVELRPAMLVSRQKLPTNSGIRSFQDPEIPPDESGAAPCGCASCGRENPLLCCPNRGQCLGCSSCGTVCCPAG
jgi:hypothetical protein